MNELNNIIKEQGYVKLCEKCFDDWEIPIGYLDVDFVLSKDNECQNDPCLKR